MIKDIALRGHSSIMFIIVEIKNKIASIEYKHFELNYIYMYIYMIFFLPII
jgi:hypothetical protein